MSNTPSQATRAWSAQQARNQALIDASRYMRPSVTSSVLPFRIDVDGSTELAPTEAAALRALEREAARIALSSLASLSKINELDHLGGALDLIPALTLTMAVGQKDSFRYTFEHAHTSIGYYAVLAALGYLDPETVIDGFRRGLDIPGHVSWVPGGTELNGGRLGIMVPAAVGQALGLRARVGDEAWVICHCGDAGWISGQALNGFVGAAQHGAPVTFIMHRNGIQLSGSTKSILDKDPRPVIESLGVRILEIPTLLDTQGLYAAYREARALAKAGQASLIYPTGFRSTETEKVTLNTLGEQYGVAEALAAFAAKNGVALDTEVWIPGSLMSYRDVGPMLECVFLVNDLPGGVGHHDGHMKGRDLATELSNPMLQASPEEKAALAALRSAAPVEVRTEARPAPGSPNLVVPAEVLAGVELPAVGKTVSPRAGSESGYAVVAEQFPDDVFVVSCDLDASTKLGKARKFLAPDHQFEMSIEEQVATLMTNGLAVSSSKPQLNVVSTFAAFFEGIAREGFEMWRYQRNLNGVNEGLNAVMHLSHVGACTGRDHFSGWSLDWINLGMGYLPYLHRFYTPADARAAFLAVVDQAAHYGGHIIGIPRDNLPILEKQDGSGPLWEAGDAWEAVTAYRMYEGARKAILAVGATAHLAGEAAAALREQGCPTDVYVINGLPLPADALAGWLRTYPEGLVTVEDGIIGNEAEGIRGFASLVRGAAVGTSCPVGHIGITDPRVAPADGHYETWAHFGLTQEAVLEAVQSL